MFLIGLLFAILTAWANHIVTIKGNQYIYNSIDSIPHNHCALVLGTSKYIGNGKKNTYYTNRIKAAVDLYMNQKIDYIIVSGDNRNVNYNEPITMYNDLIQSGVQPECIILDYAGFRTLDSVVRAKEIFGQNQFTIVSQSFHNQRALYIARKRGIEAIAFNAPEVDGILTLRVQVRELAARLLLFIDQFTSKQPHFLGEKVIVPAE